MSRACEAVVWAVADGRAPDSWDEQAPDGSIVRYETVCTLMRKELA